MQQGSRRLANCPRRLGRNNRHSERRTSLPKPTVSPQANSSLPTTDFTYRCDPPPRPTIDVDLPRELWDLVAGYLRNSREGDKGLLKFSLVCRYWREIARPFVFDSLTIDSSVQDIELSKFLLTHPDEARWTRSLIYIGPEEGGHVVDGRDAWESWFGDRPKLYGLLPNLFALTIRSFRKETKTPRASFLQEIGRGFCSVKKLTVESCSGHPNEFAALISTFDNLETLSLEMVTPHCFSRGTDQEQAIDTPCNLSRLATLRLFNPGRGIKTILSHFKLLQSLRNLQLTWQLLSTLVSDSTTGGYLDMLGQEHVQIDSLSLGFPTPLFVSPRIKDGVIRNAVNFSKAFELPSLQTTHTFNFLSVPICAVSMMLKTLTNHNNNIRRVRIEVAREDKRLLQAGGDASKETEEHCTSIDQVLSRKEFLDREIKVEVSNCFYIPDLCVASGRLPAVDMSRSMFPRLVHAKALVTYGKPMCGVIE